MDPLQVTMTGVRMGERYLQIFCSDEALTRGLASKAGLSGVAALAASDAEQARRATKAGEKVGALIEIKTTTPVTLPWDDGGFDMVVVDNTHGAFAALSDQDRSRCLGESHRVLRQGGRVEFIERTGQTDSAEAMVANAGFKPVRLLAERDGFRFIEGLKG